MTNQELDAMAGEVARMLLRDTDPSDFKPHEDWHDLGLLIRALEAIGFYLMLNSAERDGRTRRIASLHREVAGGYPSAGSSEWGYFDTIGEAVLRASHEAMTRPRA